MRIIKHLSAFRLLINVINNIPISEKGTYDKADTTQYEKGTMVFMYNEEEYIISFYDCTWGIEISISKKETLLKRIASFYVDSDGIVLRQKGFCGCLQMLSNVFPETLRPDFISLRERGYICKNN
jgi:hypothetical protein